MKFSLKFTGIISTIAVALLLVACGKPKAPPHEEKSAAAELSKFPGLTNSNPAVVLKELNEIRDSLEQELMTQDKQFTEVEDFVKFGYLKELPKPPAGRTYFFDKQQRKIVLR